jgi:hypothetical protein
MSKSLNNKTFKGGFTLGISLFVLVQIVSFLRHFVLMIWLAFTTPSHISAHPMWEIGFPFSMYYWMFNFSNGKVDFNGLAGNVTFGLVLSLLIGLIFKFWTKFAQQRLK